METLRESGTGWNAVPSPTLKSDQGPALVYRGNDICSHHYEGIHYRGTINPEDKLLQAEDNGDSQAGDKGNYRVLGHPRHVTPPVPLLLCNSLEADVRWRMNLLFGFKGEEKSSTRLCRA